MSARRLAGLSAACMLLAALTAPALAVAAEAGAPEAGGILDLQTWPESGQVIIVTAITVPESVKLPATVRIPVPEGANVQWVGEVLGGDLSLDPAREYKILKSPAGGQYAEFTLEQTRSAQVDADMGVLKVEGDVTSAAFDWIQSVTAPSTSFSVRVPGNATNVKISPQPSGAPDTNAVGERLYSGDPLTLEPGAKQPVSFSFSTGAAGAAATGGSSLDTLVYALLAALGVAIVALVVLVVRQRQGAEATPPAAPSGQRRGAQVEDAASAPAPDASSDDDWGFDDLD